MVSGALLLEFLRSEFSRGSGKEWRTSRCRGGSPDHGETQRHLTLTSLGLLFLFNETKSKLESCGRAK